MSFSYMLHCADRTFYVGHTEDLDARIGAHQSGLTPGYTSTRLRETLVWSDEFPSHYEALQAERQIKGWGRAKKLALIRGGWKMISALARNAKEKERASTGSARTEERGEKKSR
jgi:predicted GIY-YIG superfamily endonuclease